MDKLSTARCKYGGTLSQDMQVRGAPAIAIAAALALAVDLINGGRVSQFSSSQEGLQCVLKHLVALFTRWDR